MEQRKVQLTGGSTLTLSLPKDWATRAGLKPGDRLAMIPQQDLSLLIVPRFEEEKRGPLEAVVEVSRNDNAIHLIRNITSQYLVGYDIIRIRSKEKQIPPKLRREIKDAIRSKLIGTEIVKESSEELEIQTLVNHTDFSVENAITRMHILASLMHKDAVEALKTLDYELAKDIISRDDEVDRFYLFTVRMLKMAIQSPRIMREVGIEKPRDSLGYRLVAKSIERIADHAVAIARNIREIKTPLDSDTLTGIIKMYNSSNRIHSNAIRALFKLDSVLANEAIDNSYELSNIEKGINKDLLQKELGTELVSAVRLILESNRRIGEYGADIAEIALNLVAKEPLL